MIRGILHFPKHVEPNCKEYIDSRSYLFLNCLVPVEKMEMDIVGIGDCIGWWKVVPRGPNDTYEGVVYLDRNSYIMKDDGTKYGYDDFHRLAMEIRNEETEQALEAL